MKNNLIKNALTIHGIVNGFKYDSTPKFEKGGKIKNDKNAIKLLEIKGLKDGTRRFQSQLLVGGDMVDFIMGKDGKMRIDGYGKNGYDFYEFKEPYIIVHNIEEMRRQKL